MGLGKGLHVIKWSPGNIHQTLHRAGLNIETTSSRFFLDINSIQEGLFITTTISVAFLDMAFNIMALVASLLYIRLDLVSSS